MITIDLWWLEMSKITGIWNSTNFELNAFWKVSGTNLGQRVKFSEKMKPDLLASTF